MTIPVYDNNMTIYRRTGLNSSVSDPGPFCPKLDRTFFLSPDPDRQTTGTYPDLDPENTDLDP